MWIDQGRGNVVHATVIKRYNLELNSDVEANRMVSTASLWGLGVGVTGQSKPFGNNGYNNAVNYDCDDHLVEKEQKRLNEASQELKFWKLKLVRLKHELSNLQMKSDGLDNYI